MRILDKQAKYANINRMLFIDGFNNIFCNLEPGAGATAGKTMDVSEWFLSRPSGFGKVLIDRIYEPVGFNGTIELVVSSEHIRMALDWSNYAINDLVSRELSEDGVKRTLKDKDRVIANYERQVQEMDHQRQVI